MIAAIGVEFTAVVRSNANRRAGLIPVRLPCPAAVLAQPAAVLCTLCVMGTPRGQRTEYCYAVCGDVFNEWVVAGRKFQSGRRSALAMYCFLSVFGSLLAY